MKQVGGENRCRSHEPALIDAPIGFQTLRICPVWVILLGPKNRMTNFSG